jgi:hypothetical protein
MSKFYLETISSSARSLSANVLYNFGPQTTRLTERKKIDILLLLLLFIKTILLLFCPGFGSNARPAADSKWVSAAAVSGWSRSEL